MRRDVVTIVIITVIVLVAVLAVGPQLSEIEFGGPAPANSIPIHPNFERAPPPEVVKPAATAPLGFEIVNAVTGQRIERDVRIELLDADGSSTDTSRGRLNGEAIRFQSPPIGTPLTAQVVLAGHLTRDTEPFRLAPGERKVIRVELTPLFRVSVDIQAVDGRELTAYRVISLSVPSWQELPVSIWQDVRPFGNAFMLPPGRYVLQMLANNPYVHPDFTGRENWLTQSELEERVAMPVGGSTVDHEFEVLDSDLQLKPEGKWETGQGQVSGRVIDVQDKPVQRLSVMALKLGPAFARKVVARARTNENGEFEFTGLAPGMYRIQPHWTEDPHGQRAFATVTVDDEPLSVELVYETYETSEGEPYALMDIRITEDGEPVRDAVLGLHGFGTFDGFWSMGHRPISLGRTSEAGELKASTRHTGNLVVCVEGRSMKLFEVVFEPGRVNKYHLELSEPGTGTLSVKFELEGASAKFARLEGKVDGARNVRFERDNPGEEFTCVAVPPGKYELVIGDGNLIEHREEVTIRADERTRIEHAFNTTSLKLSMPELPGSIRFLSVSHQRTGEVLGWRNDVSLTRYHGRTYFEPGEIGPVLDEDAYVVLWHERRVVAIASVRKGEAEVSADRWVQISPFQAESGGGFKLQSSLGDEASHNETVDIQVTRAGLPVIELCSEYISWRRDWPQRFPALMPGTWNVRVTSKYHETWEGEVTLEAGKLVTILLQAVAEESEPEPEPDVPHEGKSTGEAKDRPIGGVKIKLPAPSVPPPPPPQPPEMPEPPPPLPELPERIEGDFGGRRLVFFVSGASEPELWHTMVHARGPHAASSSGVLDYTWRRNASTPVVSLVKVEGRTALVVEGLAPWFDEITIDVPGCKPVKVDITPNETRELKLER